MSGVDDARVAGLLLQLSQLTQKPADHLQTILSMPPELRDADLALWKDQDWADPKAPWWQDVVAITGTLIGILSGVGEVAGAASAVKALVGG